MPDPISKIDDKDDRMPTFYIPHGGGPCFFMEWTMGPKSTWDKMAEWLKKLSLSVPRKPKALLIVSAHWEEEEVAINSFHSPDLLYDYSGFPEHTYHLKYPALPKPELAQRIHDLLKESSVKSSLIEGRGLDHGVFVPLKLVYPEADIPIVQMSLRRGLSAEEHLKIGQALAPLRSEGVLIIGSGMSYHNLSKFFRGGKGGLSDSAHVDFDAWLDEAACNPNIDTRWRMLIDWQSAPGARDAHPREEHLIPLMVAAGAAGLDLGLRTYSEQVMGSLSQDLNSAELNSNGTICQSN